MEALRNRSLLGVLLFASALAGAGCGLFGGEADRSVAETLRRGQAPEGPIAPKTLPASEPLPVPERPSAPVLPVDIKPGSSPPIVLPVSGSDGKASAATATTSVKVIATVGADTIITDEEVSMMMKQRARDYIQLKGEDREKKEREVFREELRKIVERELILGEFLAKVKKNNPGALDELWEQAGKIADAHLRDMRQYFKIKTEAEFTIEMEKQGLPYKPFRRQVERNALMNMFLNSLLKDKTGNPTLVQIQDYYERNKGDFKTEDKIKYLDLFVSHARFNTPEETKAYAETVWRQALAGQDFVELVKKNGHGDSVLRNGQGVGDKRGEIQPADIEETLFGIKAGNISGLVPVGSGFHILKVTERDIAGHRTLDDKLQVEIREKLKNGAIKVEKDKLVAQLWRQTGVTIVDR